MVAKSEVRTKITIENANKSADELKALEGRFQTLAGGTSSWTTALAGSSAGMGAAIAGVGALAAGAVALSAAVSSAASALYDLAQRGGTVTSVASAFERMASRETLNNLNAATRGLVSNVEVMQQYNQAIRAGILDENEITRFFALVSTGARDTGVSINDMVGTIGNLLSGGSLASLRTLGVNVVEVQEDLRENGESMRTVEGRATALRGALEQLEGLYGGLSTDITHAADALDTMSTAYRNAADDFARGFAENTGVVAALNSLSEALTGTTLNWRMFGDALGEGLSDTYRSLLSFGADIERLLETPAGRLLRHFLPFGLGAYVDDLSTGYFQAALADFDEHRNALVQPPTAGGGERSTPARAGGGGGGRSRAANPDMDFADIWQERETQWREQDISLAEEQANVDTALLDVQRQLGEEEQARATAEQAAHQTRLDNHQKEMDVMQAYIDLQREQRNQTIEDLSGYGGALTTVMGSVADVFGQASSEFKEGSKEAERYKKVQGGILAGISFVNAAIEIAKAVGSYPDVVGIAAHAASAVAYIAAGGLALRNLGGSAQAPSGSVSSGFTGSRNEPQTNEKYAGGSTINVYTMAYAQGRLGQEMQRAQYAQMSSGLDGPMMGAGAQG